MGLGKAAEMESEFEVVRGGLNFVGVKRVSGLTVGACSQVPEQGNAKRAILAEFKVRR